MASAPQLPCARLGAMAAVCGGTAWLEAPARGPAGCCATARHRRGKLALRAENGHPTRGAPDARVIDADRRSDGSGFAQEAPEQRPADAVSGMVATVAR